MSRLMYKIIDVCIYRLENEEFELRIPSENGTVVISAYSINDVLKFLEEALRKTQ